MGGTNSFATYNALNQLSTTAPPGTPRTNEWDGVNRLTAVNTGNQRTEFSYDGRNRLVGLRQLVNGSEVSHRLFTWNGGHITEEHDTNGVVTKRFFAQGVQIVTGTNAGLYYYTRDHLASIRELTDSTGNVRARYAYDPFGRRTKINGDLDADFGFAGMFWSPEANLYLTRFRAYDAALGRWVSRDPLKNAEVTEGPNLYAYVVNNPVNLTDPLGLSAGGLLAAGLHWTESEWEYFFSLAGSKGEIAEVLGEELEEVPALVSEILPELGEDLLTLGPRIMGKFYRAFGALPKRLPRVPVGIVGAFAEFLGAGVTVLVMADCDVANGLIGLIRQGKGGQLNMYEDRDMKELKRLEPW